MKKYFKSLLLAIIVIATLNGCKKDDPVPTPTPAPAPVSSFTYVKNSQNAPSNVVFSNSSQNATTYSWNFGDGATSTDANPSHTYTQSGSFTVTLTATGLGGTVSSSQILTIGAAVPIANFTYVKSSQNAPSIVTFTNISQNATTYSWNFGDGATSTDANPSHTYTQSGVFTVTLTATGIGGSNTSSQTINIGTAFTKAFIKKVTVTNFPFTNSTGGGWDPSTGPDVYYKITDANNVVLYALPTANRIDDVTPSMLPISWINAAPYWQIPDINSAIYIDLYDYETIGTDEYMGWCGGFKLSDYTTYPPTVTKTANGITVTLDIQWQ